MHFLKDMLIMGLHNVASYAGSYFLAMAIPFSLSMLKKAKLKTKSRTMAEIFSIAEDVIIAEKPLVEDLKKKGEFNRETQKAIALKVAKDIKRELKAHQTRLLRDIAGESGMLDTVIGRIVEKIIDYHKIDEFPKTFAGFHFDWKF